MSIAERNAAGLRAASANGYRNRDTGAKASNAGSKNASAPKYSASAPFSISMPTPAAVARTGLYVLGGRIDWSKAVDISEYNRIHPPWKGDTKSTIVVWKVCLIRSLVMLISWSPRTSGTPLNLDATSRAV